MARSSHLGVPKPSKNPVKRAALRPQTRHKDGNEQRKTRYNSVRQKKNRKERGREREIERERERDEWTAREGNRSA